MVTWIFQGFPCFDAMCNSGNWHDRVLIRSETRSEICISYWFMNLKNILCRICIFWRKNVGPCVFSHAYIYILEYVYWHRMSLFRICIYKTKFFAIVNKRYHFEIQLEHLNLQNRLYTQTSSKFTRYLQFFFLKINFIISPMKLSWLS